MFIALVLILVGIFVILISVGREPIPWTSRLRRVQAGVARKAEWVAPEAVIEQVRRDYLEAVEWLGSAATDKALHAAPYYLMGRFLARFQTITNYTSNEKRIHFDGILTTQHHVQVRQFSEDGSRCIVIDCQTERRMESSYANQPAWSLRQDMGDGAVVFQMCYDVTVKRWKVEAFIQELPPGWSNRVDVGYVYFHSQMPTTIGRDY